MPQRNVPAGTVTFLFSDIEGSTKLWAAFPEEMRTSLARHDALMREAIAACNGYVFKTIGDAFCAAFATAPEALAAVLAAQFTLNAEPWPAETPIKVRMALHTGAVESRDEDYFGPPVNRVARLLNAAHGGQSILSQATYELVRDSLPVGSALRDLGTHQLKDLARPEQVFQLVHPQLQADFPDLLTLSSRPNNLPLQLTSFVGRDAEIQSARRLFERSRLVTLTGAGGSGKTRLGVQIAAELLESLPDGVWLVELAAVEGEGAMLRTVASALNVTEDSGSDLSGSIAAHIQSKPLLLLLDNCEHLVDECAHLADLLLRTCPSLKILATTREALGIAGESVLRVPPLALPDPGGSHSTATLQQFDAVRLFIDRAIQADPTFLVTNDNAPAVASICCQLDGIPLAIELAAARVRALKVEAISARLDKRFQLLTGGSRVAMPRQQTLRALIDWSYDLLLPREKAVFQRLSVFAGGWDFDASDAVCQDAEIEGWEVAEIVLSLIDKSLVVVHELADVNRYSMLESIREYAKDRLTENGEQAVYQDRHLRYFVEFVERAVAGLRGHDQNRWLKDLNLNIENLRTALRHGMGTEEGLALAGRLEWYWYKTGKFIEGRSWMDAALEATPESDPRITAGALNGAGIMSWMLGDYGLALSHLHRSLALARALEDRLLIATTLVYIGNVYGQQNQYDLAEPFWLESLEICRELDAEGLPPERQVTPAVLDNLGNVAVSRGNYREAIDLYLSAYEVRKRTGNLTLVANSLINLGGAAYQLGDRASALRYYLEGLELSFDLDYPYGMTGILMGLAALATPASGVTLLGKCEAIREELGIPLSPDESEFHELVVETALKSLTQTAYDSAWAQGRSMELPEIMEISRQVGTADLQKASD